MFRFASKATAVKSAFVAAASAPFLALPCFAQNELPPVPPGVSGPLAPPPAPYVWPGIEGVCPPPLRYMIIDGKEYAADQVVVKFKDNVSESLIGTLVASSGMEQKMHIRSLGARVLTFPGPLNAKYFVDVLQRSPFVEYAHLNATLHTLQAPPPVLDPYFSQQWGLEQIDIAPAWSVARGNGVRIGIADTGVDSHQEDLANKIARNSDGTVIGFPVGNSEDDYGHGTFSASVAAAQTTFPNDTFTAVGTAGVAPSAMIVPLKAIYGNLAASIDYAVNVAKVKVINISLNSVDYDQTTAAALANASNNGVLVVVGAGNGGFDTSSSNQVRDKNGNYIAHTYPSLYWRTMPVGATINDPNNSRAYYSEVARFVSVVAPGGDPNVNSYDAQILGAYKGSGYGISWGTSVSAPHVAGLAAILFERFPTMSWENVQYRIEDTADEMNGGTLPGKDNEMGWGRVNAYTATYSLTSLSKSFAQSNWRLISLPVWPSELNPTDRSNDIATLFPGANVDVFWWLPNPNPDANNPSPGSYIPYSDPRTPRFGVGKAYYARFNSPSNSKSYAGAYSYYKDYHDFPIYLRKGLCMIGTPFNPSTSVVWNSNTAKIRTESSNGTEFVSTVAQAAQIGLVNATLYKRDYNTGQDVTVAEGETLNPFEGYWFKANQDCELLLPSSTTRAVGSFSGTMQWHTSSLLHQIGRTDGDGWSATVGVDPVGYLQHGPYTNQVATGNNVAVWDVMIDNNTANNAQIMQLDILDASANMVIASRDVMRGEFSYANAYQSFNLPFYLPSSSANHVLEFRLHWRGASYLRSRILRVVH